MLRNNIIILTYIKDMVVKIPMHCLILLYLTKDVMRLLFLLRLKMFLHKRYQGEKIIASHKRWYGGKNVVLVKNVKCERKNRD